MRLKNHRIDTAAYTAAKAIGGSITPTLVVVHDTASRLDEGSAARYLLDNSARVSVHFVIERDGRLIQQVPTNRRANHAGVSHYHGREGCNGFSIGIEIVNPGKMTFAGIGHARTWYKETFDIDAWNIHKLTTTEHGTGYWMDYTEDQIETVTVLCQALFAGIPSLTDIRPHWYVSPGRKVDTNPLFPLDVLRARIIGRDDPADLAATDESFGDLGQRMVRIDTNSSGLNMRAWPSFNPNILTQIPDGALVPLVRHGVFGGRPWLRVLFDGREGWIVAAYTSEPTPA